MENQLKINVAELKELIKKYKEIRKEKPELTTKEVWEEVKK